MTTRLDILFQSTRPSRGETTISARLRRHSIFQSTRPSRGETRLSAPVRPARRFQSTRPSRGETAKLHKFTIMNRAVLHNRPEEHGRASHYPASEHAEYMKRNTIIRVRTAMARTGYYTFAPKVSGYLPVHKQALRRHVPPSTRTYCRECRTSSCPY